MRYRSVIILILFFFNISALARISIPNYSPNVIDQNNKLSVAEIEEINQVIEQVKLAADIRPAVYILESLDSETIESLAERAFKSWKLGEQGKNNGLLLVIALKDRRNRIEVGYGLEGEIPDVTVHRILENNLNPALRKNNFARGIENTLIQLAAQRSTANRAIIDRLNQKFQYNLSPVPDKFDPRILIFIGLLYFLTGFSGLIIEKFRLHNLVNQIEADRTGPDSAETINSIRSFSRRSVWKDQILGFFLIRTFLNFFIFIPSGFLLSFQYKSNPLFISGWLLIVIFFLADLYFQAKQTRMLKSVSKFNLYLKEKRSEFVKMLSIGDMVEDPIGHFTFTQQYFSNLKRTSSSNRSSGGSGGGGSGSSSSSGGGSSGGGGSSSSW